MEVASSRDRSTENARLMHGARGPFSTELTPINQLPDILWLERNRNPSRLFRISQALLTAPQEGTCASLQSPAAVDPAAGLLPSRSLLKCRLSSCLECT